MIYTDGVHLTADSLDELYGYANKIGLNPEWIDFMGRTIHPHFDICGHVKQRVLADTNVKQVTCREIVMLCIKNFRAPVAGVEQAHDTATSDHPIDNFHPSEADFDRMIDNIFKRAGITRS